MANFNDKASAVNDAVDSGQFDPQGLNYDDFNKRTPVNEDWKKGIDLDALAQDYNTSKDQDNDWSKGIDLESLKKEYNTPYTGSNLGPLQSNNKQVQPNDTFSYLNPDVIKSGLKGGYQGLKDVVDTGAQGIGFLDNVMSKVLPTGGAERYANFNKNLEAEHAKLPTDDTAFNVGRIGGQILATAPVMPIGLISKVGMAAESLPYVGKLAGMIARGAGAGATFGAATNAANDEGLIKNVAVNTSYGAAGGPLAEAGVAGANAAIRGTKGLINKIKVNNILKNTGITSEGANNTLSRLNEANLTPTQAKVELNQLGPDATLGDLSPSLTTEVGGLASFGGKPTDILKGRYGERASKANSVAHDLMESKLGIKPDLDIEKQAIHDAASIATKSDYTIAHNSNQALDAQPIINNIDNQLTNAVGSKTKELKEARSYLYDNKGNIKTDVDQLHEARIGLDQRLYELKSEGTSQTSATYRAIQGVRDDVDKLLKTNPEMASADAKFAQHMDVKQGLDVGYKAMDKSNFDKFETAFNQATPETQDAIRKGLRAKIGDLMEKATRGELSEAQRLFGKSTNNRKIVKLAFGQDGDDVLAALEKEANQRAVEHAAKLNSLTAERRAVQERPEYGGVREGSILGDLTTGAAIDLSTGAHGAAAMTMAAKRAGGSLLSKLNKGKIDRNVEGTSDLLSRQSSHGRDTALDVLDRIQSVRGRRNNLKFYVDNRGIMSNAAIPVAKETKSRLKRLGTISEK